MSYFIKPDPMPANIEAIAEKYLKNQPFGGIITIKMEPILRSLTPLTNYKGKAWSATRRQVDQLDQVTFGRLRN